MLLLYYAFQCVTHKWNTFNISNIVYKRSIAWCLTTKLYKLLDSSLFVDEISRERHDRSTWKSHGSFKPTTPQHVFLDSVDFATLRGNLLSKTSKNGRRSMIVKLYPKYLGNYSGLEISTQSSKYNCAFGGSLVPKFIEGKSMILEM